VVTADFNGDGTCDLAAAQAPLPATAAPNQAGHSELPAGAVASPAGTNAAAQLEMKAAGPVVHAADLEPLAGSLAANPLANEPWSWQG
jgi:hypothetical protein